jgi:hypothetical protein
MQGALLLDIILGHRPSVLKLRARIYQTLLRCGDAFFILYLVLQHAGGFRILHLHGDCLVRQLHEDLHVFARQCKLGIRFFEVFYEEFSSIHVGKNLLLAVDSEDSELRDGCILASVATWEELFNRFIFKKY